MTSEQQERLAQIALRIADGYLDVYRADSQATFGELLSDSRFLLSIVKEQEAELACYCRCHVRITVRQQSCAHCGGGETYGDRP